MTAGFGRHGGGRNRNGDRRAARERGVRRALPALVLLTLLPCVAGCVERWLLVRSDPPGARVYLDAEPIGRTPVRVAFDHYGTRELLLRLETEQDGREVHYASHVELVTLEPPWHQRFPIDFLTEFLWPFPVVDEHEVMVPLRRFDAGETEARLEELLEVDGAGRSAGSDEEGPGSGRAGEDSGGDSGDDPDTDPDGAGRP